MSTHATTLNDIGINAKRELCIGLLSIKDACIILITRDLAYEV